MQKTGIKEPQKMYTEELLNTLYRYDIKHEVKSNHRKLNKINLKKLLKNKIFPLQDKSIDELQETAKLRRTKNYDNLTREDLIFSLLKSESNLAEHNYMEYFNNSTNAEIKIKINDIKLILSRLGNIVTKNNRKKIRKELYEIEKRQNLSDNEKEKIYDDLVKLANTLNKKFLLMIQDKFILFMCEVIMKKLDQVMKHPKLLLNLLNLF